MRLENEKFGDIDSIGVRMPSELKAKIKAAAKENRHSMNAEIVARLEMSFRSNFIDFRQMSAEDMAALLKNAMKELLDDEVISIKDRTARSA
jgi:UDP-N-acetyl-D-mannosaminuronate dehydrogenase